MNRAFVTGGSGFVGRNLIAQLERNRVRVKALARSESAARAVRRVGADAVIGDLESIDAMTAAMRGCQAVFHAAACVKEWGPVEEYFRVNVRGTENVLVAARQAGVRRFVLIGTEAVLAGGRPIVDADETWPIPAHTVGLYPRTKGIAEDLVLSANGGRLETMSVRPRLIWGAGDTSLLPNMIEAVRAGKFAWIDGGHYLTSTCHVDNACEGALLAAEKGAPGEVYFLTDGPPVELRAFVTRMFEAVGVEPPEREVSRSVARLSAQIGEPLARWLGFTPPVTHTAVALFGEPVTVVDAKARRELGYVGRMSRERGLREMSGPR